MRKFWFAINRYRSSTSTGFANTWNVYFTNDYKQYKKILTNGLPYSDVRFSNGERIIGTMGIRKATKQESSQARRKLAENPENDLYYAYERE